MASQDETSERRMAAVLWGEQHSGTRRGPKPALNRERIVASAIALADAEGLAAVSMQRVAESLGFTKMSLYRHVPGRAELLALMLDTAMGQPPEALTGSWREQLHTWSSQLREQCGAHPWTLDIAVGPRVFGPNELAWTETGLRALRETALGGGQRLDAIQMLAGHVRGLVRQSAAAGPEPERALAAALTGVLTDHGADYPEAAAAFAAAHAESTQDQAGEFGLHRILDGLAAHLDRIERTRLR